MPIAERFIEHDRVPGEQQRPGQSALRRRVSQCIAHHNDSGDEKQATQQLKGQHVGDEAISSQARDPSA